MQFIVAINRLATVLLPTSALLFVLAPELVPLLLGEKWSSAITPFQTLVLVLYFRAGYRVADAAVRAMGRVYEAAVRHWIYACLVVLGALIGSAWDLQGVAIGVSMAIIYNFASVILLASRVAQVAPTQILRAHLSAVLPTLGVFALCGYTADALRRLSEDPLLPLATGAAVFLLIMWLTISVSGRLHGTGMGAAYLELRSLLK